MEEAAEGITITALLAVVGVVTTALVVTQLAAEEATQAAAEGVAVEVVAAVGEEDVVEAAAEKVASKSPL